MFVIDERLLCVSFPPHGGAAGARDTRNTGSCCFTTKHVFVQDSKSNIYLLTQLIILLGRYHILVKKWAKAQPNSEHNFFFNNTVGLLLTIMYNNRNKKAKRTDMKH